jgi:hypothetical protein
MSSRSLNEASLRPSERGCLVYNHNFGLLGGEEGGLMDPPEEETPTRDWIACPDTLDPEKILPSLAVKGGMKLINQ